MCAEDPAQDFLPQAGRLAVWHSPQGPGLRVDAGVESGDEIPVHYDSLLAKLVARGGTRHEAIRRATAALERFVVLGVRTNLGLLRRVLAHPRFQSGDIDTGFVTTERQALLAPPASSDERAALAAAAWLAALGGLADEAPGGCELADGAESGYPWATLTGWRG